MTIETVVGTLAEVYKLLRPKSIRHVDELMTERRTNEKLCGQWFYTADGEVYSLQGEDRTPTLAITRGSSNPLLQDSTINRYCRELLQNKNYRPTPDETLRALHAQDTVLVDLTKLRLRIVDEEFSYLAIDIKKHTTLNPEERTLAQRVYGKDEDFTQTMKMLADSGIGETRVYVLNPEYVRTHAQESPLGLSSWLSNFYFSSGFGANGRNINCHGRARGVRREVVVASESAADAAAKM